jgi:hypothetical protein
VVGNAIRMMTRAPKSRAGFRFGAAIGLLSTLEGVAPMISSGRAGWTSSPSRRGRGACSAFRVRRGHSPRLGCAYP